MLAVQDLWRSYSIFVVPHVSQCSLMRKHSNTTERVWDNHCHPALDFTDPMSLQIRWRNRWENDPAQDTDLTPTCKMPPHMSSSSARTPMPLHHVIAGGMGLFWESPALPHAFVESPKYGERTSLPHHAYMDKLSNNYPGWVNNMAVRLEDLRWSLVENCQLVRLNSFTLCVTDLPIKDREETLHHYHYTETLKTDFFVYQN